MRAALTAIALCAVALGAAACNKDKQADGAAPPAAGSHPRRPGRAAAS